VSRSRFGEELEYFGANVIAFLIIKERRIAAGNLEADHSFAIQKCE